jgi:hypothetical protein
MRYPRSSCSPPPATAGPSCYSASAPRSDVQGSHGQGFDVQGSHGQGFDVQGCDIFLGFRDGLLAHYTAAFEIVDMLRQIGALPPRGDRKGGAYLLSLLEHEPAETSVSHEGTKA